jgi:tRNA-specific 2-thiouridylase
LSPEEVLSLASNKNIYSNGEGGREASRGSLFYYWSTKRTQCGRNKDPLFIIATNVETNTIYTGLSSQHPGLFRKGLFIEKSSTLDSE